MLRQSAVVAKPATLPGAKPKHSQLGCMGYFVLALVGLFVLARLGGQAPSTDARSQLQTLANGQTAALASVSAGQNVVSEVAADRSAAVGSFVGASAAAQSPADDAIDVVSWNIGLDDADLSTIAQQIGAFDGVDLWGLQEVNSRSAPPVLAEAAGNGEDAGFAAIQGNAGDGLHLVALYNQDRFRLLEWWELNDINTTGNVRPPLVLFLEDQPTGLRFLFMVNHLYRSRESERHQQARLLNEWASTQELPTIAVGDYNFDWDIVRGDQQHDLGYDLMAAQGRWQWVRPDELTTTQCSGWPCRYNSVLDFVFLNQAAQAWKAQSEIVVTPGDFPDDDTTSDHRPVRSRIWPEQVAASVVIKLPTPTPDPYLSPPTAVPTPTSQPTATPTPVRPTVVDGANLRSGPGTGYTVVGGAAAGQSLDVVGRSADGGWLHLANGAWIAAFLVTNAPSALPVVAAPALPPTPVQGSSRSVSVPQAAPVVQPAGNCDPSYPTVCIPPPPPDLDCGEIRYRRFTVVGNDPHRFDGDNDGVGCESR